MYVPSAAVWAEPSVNVGGAKLTVSRETSVPLAFRKTSAKCPLPTEDGDTRARIVRLKLPPGTTFRGLEFTNVCWEAVADIRIDVPFASEPG